MVGQEMLKVLENRRFPADELYPVASGKSVGKMLRFRDSEFRVLSVDNVLNLDVDIALFSAGGDFSKKYARRFNENGIRVIDNSSAWRMDENVKLIVPEINGHLLNGSDFLISNPNCSTIQMVMVLWPLHQKYCLNRVVVSTYQSITGTGKKAVEQLEAERKGRPHEKVYPYQIDMNCIPHCDSFEDNGYTKEEMKLVNESRKIMGIPDLRVTATAVRVPVVGGHSEAVNVTFEQPVDLNELRDILENTPGVVVQDDPNSNKYPMPGTAQGRDEVFVGRIRKDESVENGVNLWIVSDNLRKGAATNSVQIAEQLLKVNQPA